MKTDEQAARDFKRDIEAVLVALLSCLTLLSIYYLSSTDYARYAMRCMENPIYFYPIF